MTNTPKKLIVDLDKGTHEYVDFTAEEITQRELDAITWETNKAEREAEETRITALKESAKAKLIAGEPLTGDEAAVLVI